MDIGIKKTIGVLCEIQEADSEGKKWYKSKTIIVNIITIIAFIIQKYFYPTLVIDAGDMAIILAGVNCLLRLVTKSSTGFYKPEEDIKDDTGIVDSSNSVSVIPPVITNLQNTDDKK
jgi:hypothetical protein